MDLIIVGIDAPGRLGIRQSIGGWAVYIASGPDRGTLLETGQFIFPPELPERDCYLGIAKILDDVKREHGMHVLVLEHPFIFVIAQWIGAFKLWASLRNVQWYMITSSSARKAVLGSGKTGSGMAKVNKIAVLEAMRTRFRSPNLTQHEADAALYAVAYAVRTKGATRKERKEVDSDE